MSLLKNLINPEEVKLVFSNSAAPTENTNQIQLTVDKDYSFIPVKPIEIWQIVFTGNAEKLVLTLNQVKIAELILIGKYIWELTNPIILTPLDSLVIAADSKIEIGLIYKANQTVKEIPNLQVISQSGEVETIDS